MDAQTRIMDAVKEAKWDEVRRLIGSEPSLAAARDASGVSLVMTLAYYGQTELAALAAAHKATDIFEATALSDLAHLEEILAATPGAVNTQSADGWTALHLAGFFGRPQAAKLLIAHGADFSAYCNNAMRNMPLHAALAGAQNIELIRLLLESGASVKATGATGITPLHLAASRGNQAAIDMLLAKGADKAVKMDNGQRPADLAREHGFPAVADALE
jgi:ankyrin repeat protein